MSWSFFTNTGAMKTSGQITGAVTTIASASSISVTPGYTHLITGTTAISTMTGGVAGGMVTLVASGQSTGVCVVLNNGTSSNNLSLRDAANLGIYAGESVTLVYDGAKWVEVDRSLKTVLDTVSITANVTFTATTEATANTLITSNSVTFDGSTPIKIVFASSEIVMPTNVNGTLVLYDGSSSVGYTNGMTQPTSALYGMGVPLRYEARLTPTAAARAYSIRGYVTSGTGTIYAGAGGSGARRPGVLQIIRDL